MQKSSSPLARAQRIVSGALFLGMLSGLCLAEDWGAYSIVPVSAPALVLEATGKEEGAIVSIGKPAGGAPQKWMVVAKGDNLFAIQSTANPALVLAAAKGATKIGTVIVLEKDDGQPWQRWELKRLDNGAYNVLPKHAPGMGLDDLGGKQVPGAKIDLWQNAPNDPHLQWKILPLAGSPATPTTTAAPTASSSKYQPVEVKPEDVLPGMTKQFSFAQSAIFPGTVRDVTVFIPAQYDGSKPACVYVKTDGYNPKEKALMETMIAAKEMPVTIGVFVRPGDLPAPMKGTLGRRNRDLEYDGVSDDKVRFLVDELLPYIAKEYQLKLSTDGNDRCISGGSSGGIAAFTAAWHRPDAFSRVYAASGSWVAFRGGHEFPTMVRKYEAKPIRAFLTTGTHDMENCAGDWFLLDQEMDKALKFSGYDYLFRSIEGPHVVGYMDNFREAMAFLWKGWPQRVEAGPSAPRAQDVLLPGEQWQPVAQPGKAASSPVCNAKGEVFYIDTAAKKIERMAIDGTIQDFVANAGPVNGLTIGADGTLYSVSAETGKIVSYDEAGKGTTVAEGIFGHSILAMPKGGFYVTCNGKQPGEGGSVWWVQPDGQKMLVDSGLKRATGLTYRPDQWLLSVADGGSKWGYSYQLNADGKLTNKERFFWWHVADWDDDAGTESLCYALEGQMFAATRSGIQVSADDGPTQVILPVPDNHRVVGVCLGGAGLDTLFAFSGDKIWKRKVKTHACGAFSPWTKVSGTRL